MEMGILFYEYCRCSGAAVGLILSSRKYVQILVYYLRLIFTELILAYAPVLLEKKAQRIRNEQAATGGTPRTVLTVYETAEKRS